MLRRKAQEEHENHERWLVSYADFITLLFAFFVVMFASSHADAKRAAVVSQSIRQAYQGEPRKPGVLSRVLGRTKDPSQNKNPGDFAEVKKPSDKETKPEAPKPTLESTFGVLKIDLAREIAEGKIQLGLDRRGIVIHLPANTFFPSGDDKVVPEMMDTIRKIAAAVGKIPNPVRLEGHTDSVPLRGGGRFPSNWHLSAARAVALLDLFRTTFGIASERMAVVGYAETKPIDTNETPEGRARNRRVDVVLLNDTTRENDPEAAEKKAAPAAPVVKAESAPLWKRWLHL